MMENHSLDSSEDLFQQTGISQTEFEEAWCVLATKRDIVYKRQPSDCWVNQHNPHLLKAWNANCDLQYIVDPCSCIRYIVSYISKKESEEGEVLRNLQESLRQDNTVPKVELQRLGKAYLTHREISVMEAIYRASGMHLKDCSREVVWVPIDMSSTRMTLPLSVLRQRDPDSEDVWATSVIDRYRARPNTRDFQGMSLAEFVSFFKISACGERKEKTNGDGILHETCGGREDTTSDSSKCIPLNDNMGITTRRKAGKECIIRFPKASMSKDSERHYHNLLVLYLPHYSKNFKPDVFETYEEFFTSGTVQHQGTNQCVSTLIQQKRTRFEIDSQAVDDALEEVQRHPASEDAWAQLAPEAEAARLEAPTPLDDNEQYQEINMSDLPDLETNFAQGNRAFSRLSVEQSILTVPEQKAREIMRSMNMMQRNVFNFVRNWCVNKVKGDNSPPFNIFLTGGAGTGKSHVIKALMYEASKILRPTTTSPEDMTVLLVAPTGTAAFNIGGRTVHSAFHLPTRGLSKTYVPLGEDLLTGLRAKYEHLEIVIINEISMVSKGMLNYISGRLDQLKRNKSSSWFGGISILAVGDFYQLPPVGGQIIVRRNPSALAEPWDVFQKTNLTEIMRQQDDQPFAQMLNYLRTHEKGSAVPPQHLKMLQGRVTDSPPQDALHIFPFRKAAASHNLAMTESLTGEKRQVTAVDILQDRSGIKKERSSPLPSEANLPIHITLCIGSRVMMTSNINVEDGLVNGVMGDVKSTS